MQRDKKILEYQSKLANNNNVLDRLVYSDAIMMLNQDVNPDKVQNWVNKVFLTFNDKPRPLTEKQKLKEIVKKENRSNRINKAIEIDREIKQLFDLHQIVCMAFFDSQDICESDFNMLQKIITDGGLFFYFQIDGGIEIIISRKKLDENIYITGLKEIQSKIDLLGLNKTLLDELIIYDVDAFKEKILRILAK